MATHPNADILRRLYEAFLKEDVETATELIAPDVRWHEAGSSEVITGRDAVAARLGTASAVQADVDVHDIIGGDDHTISLITARMRKPNGDEVTYPAVEVVHIADGRVTERWAFMDAAPADVQAFFADMG